ncbi:MAG: hypothetical protein AAGA70_09355 [Pseudomonadota bacterium]
MKTLVLEPDPMRARHWVLQFGGSCDRCDVARSTAQARLMLIGASYDRICLRLGAMSGASFALLAVARATSPLCEVVDLGSLRSRLATGPYVDDLVEPQLSPSTVPIIG